MEKDTPLRLKRRAGTALTCCAFLSAMWGLSHWPGFVEVVYARIVSYDIARALSLVTGVVPTSLAELLLAGVGLYLIAPLVMATVRVIQHERSVSNAIAAGVLRISTFAVVVVSLFYLSWGLNYARAPLATRLGWPPVERPADKADNDRQTREIAGLAADLVAATNANYRQFAGRDDLERPSDRPAGSPGLDAILDAAYARVQQRLALEPAFGVARGRAKPLVASAVMNHLQLTGFYFPWTGEANYNRLEPTPALPHTIAHEKAHQRGIAREDEANFIGYLVCIMSDDPYARYSGYLFAQRQLLSELVPHDPDRARTLIGLRARGVQRDVDFIRAFWQQYEGAASRVSETVNNTYLRSQGDRRGVAAYAASKSLIVLFARHNGGSAVVVPSPSR
jgi:hypothetical protein